MASKAVVPTATLYCALLVVDEGSFPMYTELSSTNASVKSLIDVDVDDSIFELTRARLPWLIVGLIGGIGAAFVMVGFDEILIQNEILFYFTPLIAAMAGNVGVQSSAIIVQGLANDDIRGSINNRLFKETLLSILNGVILAILLFLFIYFWKGDTNIALALSVALVAVVIVAGIIGTFIPLFLNKRGYAPVVICTKCGYSISCPNCDFALVFHKNKYIELINKHIIICYNITLILGYNLSLSTK